jgi:hypothetical protein
VPERNDAGTAVFAKHREPGKMPGTPDMKAESRLIPGTAQ